ncbi:MAG TPA: hypothetical protein VI775_00475 [Candidatus Paceibacterota bacterium]
MPKTKEQRSNYNLDEEKIINIDTEEKDLDEVITDEEEDTDEVEEAILDDEEINPFGDRWEE